MIGIDPSFRVGEEEGELRLLKQDVLDEMLEEHYAKDEEEFREFVEKNMEQAERIKRLRN